MVTMFVRGGFEVLLLGAERGQAAQMDGRI
jgi:hypothetical protein